MVAKEAGRGEMDWEFGMSGCKLLDIGWIINKVWLYSTGNYIQYPMINHNGKEYEKEHVCVCVCVCVCVWITLLYSTNQHCRSPMCACVLKLLQSCSILCNPMDGSLPGSSVHRILQARVLEWVAMPSSRVSPSSPVAHTLQTFFTTEPPWKPCESAILQ